MKHLSWLHLELWKLEVDVYCISMIFFKVFYERSCQLFHLWSTLHLGQYGNRKCWIFILIKFINVRLEKRCSWCLHDFYWNCSTKEAINTSFVERPVNGSIYEIKRKNQLSWLNLGIENYKFMHIAFLWCSL